MSREKPIRHRVHSYVRSTEEGKRVKVSQYMRGSGVKRASSNPRIKDLKYKRARLMDADEAVKYRNYISKSLHGELEVGKFAEPVELKLVKAKMSQLDSLTSSRPDFEESVQYHMDTIRNGRTICPILIHKLPNGRYQVLDGNARVEAYRRLGIQEFPAVENSILGKIASGIGKVGQYVVIGGYKAASLGLKGVSKAAGLAQKAAPVVGKGLLVTGKTVGHAVGTGVKLTGQAVSSGAKAVGTGLVTAGTGLATYGAYKADVEARTLYEGGKQQAMMAYNVVRTKAIQNLLKDAYSKDYARRTAARVALRKYYPNVYAIADFGYTQPIYQAYNPYTENPQ